MMTPNKLSPDSLRRWYRVWLIGGIVFSIACVYTLFFTVNGRYDFMSYLGILVPIWWLGCAYYCTRRIKYLTRVSSSQDKKDFDK